MINQNDKKYLLSFSLLNLFNICCQNKHAKELLISLEMGHMMQIFRRFTYFGNFKCSDSTFIAQSSIVTLILHTSLEGLVNAYADRQKCHWLNLNFTLPCIRYHNLH